MGGVNGGGVMGGVNWWSDGLIDGGVMVGVEWRE